jgi:hypothetical protein
MKNLLSRLNRGINHFGSSSVNSEEFNIFFNDFKKSFTNQLRKLKATEIEFSKGHFYLSGFFKVGEQYFYFSLSDVRSSFGDDKLLIRTAKHNKDYTGGGNNYVTIKSGMYNDIAKLFNLEVYNNPTANFKGNDYILDKAKKIINKGGFVTMKVPSMKKANLIAWKVSSLLDLRSESITEYKLGRYKSSARMETDLFTYKYDVGDKSLTIHFFDESDEQFKQRVFKNRNDIPEKTYMVTNPYSGETCELNRDEFIVHNFVKLAEMNGNNIDLQKGLSLFAEMSGEKYMVLLD